MKAVSVICLCYRRLIAYFFEARNNDETMMYKSATEDALEKSHVVRIETNSLILCRCREPSTLSSSSNGVDLNSKDSAKGSVPSEEMTDTPAVDINSNPDAKTIDQVEKYSVPLFNTVRPRTPTSLVSDTGGIYCPIIRRGRGVEKNLYLW